jgi:hypothetical protein
VRANILSITASDVATPDEATFHAWYEGKHMPEHVACPGFVRAARYRAVTPGPRFLAAYDIESEKALTTPEVAIAGREGWGEVLSALRFVASRRYRHAFSLDNPDHSRDRKPAPCLVTLCFDVRPAVDQQDVLDWVDETLAPTVLARAGVRGLTRYTPTDGLTAHLVLIEADDPQGADTLPLTQRIGDMRTQWSATYERIFAIHHQ